MLTIFCRAVILYIIMVVAMRALGKRQLGQFQPYEFAVTIIIADLIASPIGDMSTPLLQGVLPVAALYILHSLITVISAKSDKARSVISGRPSMIVQDGVIDRAEMNRLCLTISDLMEGLRQQGVMDPARTAAAVFEANGAISAFPIPDPPENRARRLPILLIADGRVQSDNLREHGLSLRRLSEALAGMGVSVSDVYIATLSEDGNLRVQTMRDEILQSKEKEAFPCVR